MEAPRAKAVSSTSVSSLPQVICLSLGVAVLNLAWPEGVLCLCDLILMKDMRVGGSSMYSNYPTSECLSKQLIMLSFFF